jgi:NAD(P)-dependent dehydrogenase (short-subunit alcohol dehydrogenase family)
MTRIWLITGASSGFGRALAEAVLERGDCVVIGARRTAPLKRVAALAADRALAVRLDVTQASDRKEAVAATLQRFGRIDVLANIAGRGSLGAAEEFSAAQLHDQMEVNFFAAAEMTRLVLPEMRSKSKGHILQMTSIGGLVAFQGFAAYCASKFALEGWSEALREEISSLGIKVTIVEPGAFRTEFAGSNNMRPERRLAAYRPVIDPVEKYLYGGDGKQPGDPRKAAAAIIAAVESSKPPFRLILGSDAVELLERKKAALESDLARWDQVGIETRFEGANFRKAGS